MTTSGGQQRMATSGTPSPAGIADSEGETAFDAMHRFVALCIEATARLTDPERVARLSFATGRACEELLDDRARAEECYLEAFGRDPDFVPNLKAARRLKAASGGWRAVLDLIDAELRRGQLKPEAQAELYLERARIFEITFGDLAGAREAYACAMELDEHNPVLWLRLSGALAADKAWVELDDLLERVLEMAEAPALKAELLSHRAALKVDRLDEADAAIALYEEAIELKNDLAHAYSGLKRLYRKAKRWSDLIELYKRELKLLEGPAKVHAYYQAARLSTRRLGRADLAIEYLEKAEQFDPDNLLVLGELGRLYEQAAKFEEQVRVNERLLELSDEPAEQLELYYRLGTTCEEQLYNDDRAITHYRRAVELRPGYGPAIQALGRLYRKHSRLEELLEMHFIEARQATDVERQALAHYRAGELLEAQLSRVDVAVDQYEEAVRWVPSFLPAQRALHRLYAKLERWEDLIKLYEHEVESLRGGSLVGDRRDPLRVARLELIARLWEDKAVNLERAAETYQRILELDPGYMGALFALKRIYEKAERWSELIEQLEREVELVEDEGWAAALLHQIGEIAEEHLDDRELAMLYYRRALTIRPAYVPALTNLGRIFADQGRFSDVLAMYSKEAEVTEQVQRRATIAFRMGAIYENRLDDSANAEESYRQALELDPELWPAMQALERLLTKRRRWEDLAEVLEGQARLIDSPQSKAVAFFRVGELWEDRLGKLDNAWDVYNHSLRANPAFYPARVALARLSRQRDVLNQLADVLSDQLGAVGDGFAAVEVLAELGDLWRYDLDAPEQAVEAYSEMAALAPDELSALIALYELRRMQGDVDELADVCRHIASSCEDPMIKVGALRELGEILDRRFADPSEAKELWAEVLSLRSEDLAARQALGADVGEREAIEILPAEIAAATELFGAVSVEGQSSIARALEVFQAMYAAEHDWEGLIQALDSILDIFSLKFHSEVSDEEHGAQLRLVTRSIESTKARVLGEHLGNTKAAERLIRALIDETSDNTELRVDLAAILSLDEPRRDEAIAEYQHVLELDPCRPDIMRGLARAWTEAGQHDRAHCAIGALSCFNRAQPDERDAYVERRRVQNGRLWRTVEYDELVGRAAINAMRSLPQEVPALLTILNPYLSSVYPPDLGASGLTVDDRLPPHEDNHLWVRGEHLCGFLGLPGFDIYLHQVPGRAEAVEVTEPPSVILPQQAESWRSQQQTFVIAQLMADVILGTWIARKLSPLELETLLVAATKIHVEDFLSLGAEPESVDSLRRKLERVLPESVQDDLVEPARAFAARGDDPIDYGAWLSELRQASHRIGLMACGDLEAALTMVGREESDIAPRTLDSEQDVLELARSSETSRDLVRWYLSEDHFALRRLAGFDQET